MYKIYFLKPGTHTDSNGESEKYSLSDLIEIKDSYSPEIFKAPVVIGHNDDINALYKNDKAPSYGWIKKLGIDDKGLYAETSLVKEFEELLDREVPPYKYISAAIYEPSNSFNPVKGKKYLRHIAFLGSQPPAIKGLPPVAKMYSESNLLNTMEVFNNNKILKIDNEKHEMKKYMVEDLDNYQEVVKLPNPESASTEEIKSFLDDNAFDFITYILTEGEYGYPGEITSFDVMPSEENNYLFNPETNSFSGVFYDDTSSEIDGYRFEIRKSGDSWTSSYIPVNQSESESDLPTNEVDGFAEDEFKVTEEVELTSQDESKLAMGEIPESEVVEEGEEDEKDLKSELEMVLSESRNLRNEVLKLKNELNEMKMNEYRAYSEKFNSIIKGTNIKSNDLATLLFEIDNFSNKRRLTKAYSENIKESPINLLKQLLEETLNKVNSNGIATYGEFSPDSENEEEVVVDSFGGYKTQPIGAVYSDEGMDMHKKVLSYCNKNNMNPKDISQYLEAYKAVCK